MLRKLKNVSNKITRRAAIFIILLLTVDGDTIAKIIIALSERQPNGRSDIEPYTNAKKLSHWLKRLY